MFSLQAGIGFLCFILLTLPACQKVIQVDLNSASSTLVIEGVITDSNGPYKVLLSKTGSFFDSLKLAAVSGAKVIIREDDGNPDTLLEFRPGVYLTSTIKGSPGHTYSLKVISEGKEYDASSSMMSRVAIDSLKVEETTGFGGRINHNVICHFKDKKGEKNYYRLKFYQNGKSNAENYRLYDDQYTDGESIAMRAGGVKPGDHDKVELMSIDKKTYDYYRTLEDIIRTNPFFGSTPANPNSNISNGALGYFSAYSMTSKTININK